MKTRTLNSIAGALQKSDSDMGDMRVFPRTKRYGSDCFGKLLKLGTLAGGIMFSGKLVLDLVFKPLGRIAKNRDDNRRPNRR